MFLTEIITLSGDLGSGKGSSAKILEKKLGYEYFSIGSLQRSMAEEKGLNVLQLNEISLQNPNIDIALDSRLKNFKQGNKLIIDGRMAFFFIPESFKVYLTVDPQIAAERIFKDKIRKGEQHTSVQETLSKNEERKHLENIRYYKTYGIKVNDLKYYDFVLDTTHLSIEETASKILEAYSKHLNQKKSKKIILFSSLSIFLILSMILMFFLNKKS